MTQEAPHVASWVNQVREARCGEWGKERLSNVREQEPYTASAFCDTRA